FLLYQIKLNVHTVGGCLPLTEVELFEGGPAPCEGKPSETARRFSEAVRRRMRPGKKVRTEHGQRKSDLICDSRDAGGVRAHCWGRCPTGFFGCGWISDSERGLGRIAGTAERRRG